MTFNPIKFAILPRLFNLPKKVKMLSLNCKTKINSSIITLNSKIKSKILRMKEDTEFLSTLKDKQESFLML